MSRHPVTVPECFSCILTGYRLMPMLWPACLCKDICRLCNGSFPLCYGVCVCVTKCTNDFLTGGQSEYSSLRVATCSCCLQAAQKQAWLLVHCCGSSDRWPYYMNTQSSACSAVEAGWRLDGNTWIPQTTKGQHCSCGATRCQRSCLKLVDSRRGLSFQLGVLIFKLCAQSLHCHPPPFQAE